MTLLTAPLLSSVIEQGWTTEFDDPEQRLSDQDELDQRMGSWTAGYEKFELQALLRGLPVPASAVQKPAERVDADPTTAGFGLWPSVEHTAMGEVRVDGQPVHFSRTDWESSRGAPCLGEHNEQILCGLLGYTPSEVARLREDKII